MKCRKNVGEREKKKLKQAVVSEERMLPLTRYGARFIIPFSHLSLKQTNHRRLPLKYKVAISVQHSFYRTMDLWFHKVSVTLPWHLLI